MQLRNRLRCATIFDPKAQTLLVGEAYPRAKGFLDALSNSHAALTFGSCEFVDDEKTGMTSKYNILREKVQKQ